jgi:hypothetical protein
MENREAENGTEKQETGKKPGDAGRAADCRESPILGAGLRRAD